MPRFTLDNSFRFGSRRETITNFHSESIEKILKKLSEDWLRQFAREEKIQADLIGWKKMLVKINMVLDDAVERQRKEESVKMWLGKLRNLACDVDYLLDEFQTEAFQRMLLLDDVGMSKVKEVNARLQDIASQIELLALGKKSGGKSRNVGRATVALVRAVIIGDPIGVIVPLLDLILTPTLEDSKADPSARSSGDTNFELLDYDSGS